MLVKSYLLTTEELLRNDITIYVIKHSQKIRYIKLKLTRLHLITNVNYQYLI